MDNNQSIDNPDSDSIIVIAKFISFHKYLIASFLGTCIITISSCLTSLFPVVKSINSEIVFVENKWFYSPWLGLALGLILIGFGLYKDKKEKDRLYYECNRLKDIEDKNKTDKKSFKKEIDNLQMTCSGMLAEKIDLHKRLVETWLQVISVELGFETYERITIFYMGEDKFHLLARYCANPDNMVGDGENFLKGKGVVKFAWKRKEFIHTDDPIYEEGFLSNIKSICKDYQSLICSFIRDTISLEKGTKGPIERKGSGSDKDAFNELSRKGES